MYAQQKDLLTKMNEYFTNTEQTINKLNQELSIIKIERDMYKEQLIQLQKQTIVKEGIAYTVRYTHDNGEGMDTELCIGVFSSRTKALTAIMDICKTNELDSIMFDIVEFDVGHPIQPKSTVYVTHEDEETHCEVSTRIIDVKMNEVQHYTDKDVYDVKFIVDDYVTVYPFGI